MTRLIPTIHQRKFLYNLPRINRGAQVALRRERDVQNRPACGENDGANRVTPENELNRRRLQIFGLGLSSIGRLYHSIPLLVRRLFVGLVSSDDK